MEKYYSAKVIYFSLNTNENELEELLQQYGFKIKNSYFLEKIIFVIAEIKQ